MWCLETIVKVNGKISDGKTVAKAFAEVGVQMPQGRRQGEETRLIPKKVS